MQWQEEPKRRTKVEQKEVRVRRPLVGVSLGYPLYDEVRRASDDEPVKMAAFVLEVFRCGWRVYHRVAR